MNYKIRCFLIGSCIEITTTCVATAEDKVMVVVVVRYHLVMKTQQLQEWLHRNKLPIGPQKEIHMTMIGHAALEDVGDCVNVSKQTVWPKEKNMGNKITGS